MEAGRLSQTTKEPINLANGTETTVRAISDLTIRVGGIRVNHLAVNHRFGVLPTLRSTMLIGTDLWAKLGITVLVPPRAKDILVPRTNRVATITGDISTGITLRSKAEDRCFRQFREELLKFESVRDLTDRITHTIHLKPGPPIKQRYRPRNSAMQAIINAEVDKMLEAGIIEPSNSLWSSLVVLVKKRDGAYRFCIDFRKLNQASEKDAYPFPHITATLDKLIGAKYLSRSQGWVLASASRIS